MRSFVDAFEGVRCILVGINKKEKVENRTGRGKRRRRRIGAYTLRLSKPRARMNTGRNLARVSRGKVMK